jgi:hypothetical protein
MKKIEFDTELDKNGQEKLRVRITTNKGQLIEVMYQYESFLDNHWINIVRYDCFHGVFHRDVMLPNGDKEKYEIAIDNLKTASKYAEQDLKDRWEWYRERYIKKMKRRKQNDK